MTSKVMRLLFVGPPGVGKGTYAARVAETRKCAHISSGDLLRAEVQQQSTIGNQIGKLINAGEFVPDALIASMIAGHIAKVREAGTTGYILDGYPRNIAQAEALWTGGDITIDHVINLTQPANVIITKISSRRSCASCGFSYNYARIDEGGIKMDPLVPKVEGCCDRCGSTEPFIIRKDDAYETVKHRLDIYEKTAGPMLAFYKEKKVLHEFPVLGGAKQYTPMLLDLIDSLP